MNTVLDSFPSFFIVDLEPPALASGLEVDASQSPLVFRWVDDPNALYFQVFVNASDPTASFTPIVSWFGKPDGSLTCDGSMCQMQIDETFPVSNYDVFIQAWGPGGFSTGGIQGWAQFSFSVDTPQQSSLIFSSPSPGEVSLRWSKTQNAAAYEVWVGNVDANETIWHRVYTSADLDCEMNEVCELPLDSILMNGQYHWYIRPYLADGSPLRWSTGEVISIQLPPPEKIDSMQTVSSDGLTQLVWQVQENAVWYRMYLQVVDTGAAHDQWYEAQAICDGSRCEVSFPLPSGGYLWFLQPMGPGGEGAWSEPVNFSIDR